MGVLWSDLKHAARMLRKAPAFTLTAVCTLALGIGANTAVFSVVNAVLLKPVPVPDPDRFVALMSMFVFPDGRKASAPAASPAKFQHWRAQSDVLTDVTAFTPGVMNLTGTDAPEQVRSMRMSAAGFRCWGLPVVRGRAYTEQEDIPNGPRLVLISEALWTSRYARDPQVLGKAISLSGEPYTVIGIIGGSNQSLLEFGALPDVYVPFPFDPNTTDQGHYFQVVARLAPGMGLRQAQTRIVASAESYRARFPDALGKGGGFTVMSYREAMVQDVHTVLFVLLGTVSLVLLIACANIANLMLVRANGRRREIAIRAALGAGRARVVRQLLTESLLLSAAGGALGMLLGFVGIRALLTVNTAGLPRLGESGVTVGLDWRLALFAIGISLFSGVLFGLLPALHASRVDLNSVLKESAGRSGTGLRQNITRAFLVASEMALAVILLVGSALLIRSLVALYSVNRGFDVNNVITMKTSLTGPRFAKTANVNLASDNALERIRALPGVVDAAESCCLPTEGNYTLGFNIVGQAPRDGPFTGIGGWTIVSPGYFETFKMPVKRGRTFTERDAGKSSPVVIINETMAKQFWKDRDPLLDRILIGGGARSMKELKDEPPRQIVGIVGDVRGGNATRAPRPEMYLPQAQIPDALNALDLQIFPVAWAIRTAGNSRALVLAIQQELRQATGVAVTDVRSMSEIVALSMARQRFNMLLMTVFGAAALLLAAVGIYGLMSYSVQQRTQEIGIRLALGAEASQVRRMVVRQGMVLATVGVVIGLVGAFGLTRFIESILFGVGVRDPFVFVAVPALLSVVALAAVWIPAARASRVDPAEALRYE